MGQFAPWSRKSRVVDNRTFRPGERLSARRPSAAGYGEQVAKEHRWLPWLAP
ncbi:MAG: hypothetical protein M3171_07345 [Actinomycetota bacterium]|nr:hypothetical protein [Actinomycetota bacterium]